MAIQPSGLRSGCIRTFAAAVTACGILAAGTFPSAASAASNQELAQPARGKRHAGPREKPTEKMPVPRAAPAEKRQGIEPTERETRPEEPSSAPDDEEEVSPGEDPASCDGCELAMVSLGGTLWGMFGVSRRRGMPRTVIRGLRPR